MKLEAEMYVRTKWGGFFKLNYYDEKEKRWICVGKYNWSPIYESEVKKASHNIIDLIEVGDYVNGRKVIKNCLEDGGNIILFENGFCATNKDIKSIVTKEEFESISYKMGD